VMAYCRAAEFKMVTTVQAGVRVITPDFWVVRVSLLGLDERGLIKLMNVLRKDKSPSVAKHLDVTPTPPCTIPPPPYWHGWEHTPETPSGSPPRTRGSLGATLPRCRDLPRAA